MRKLLKSVNIRFPCLKYFEAFVFVWQVGDLPDAEVKPEDNVLFVCKLNPVTTDEDLEIIFSRFGPIKRLFILKASDFVIKNYPCFTDAD